MPTVSQPPTAVQAAARLIAIAWTRQFRDAGEPEPPLRQLTSIVLREVRQQ
jgi:hypothetical protein